MSKKSLSQRRDSRHPPRVALWGGAAALAIALSACSPADQSSSPQSPPASSTQPAPSIGVASLHKLSSTVTAAGIATRYDAYFDQQQLKAILESRQAPSSGHGEYLYMGARLIAYNGNPLHDAAGTRKGKIELKFDLQGRLVSARDPRNPAYTIEQAQLDALRARAELLRSHALTQRSVSVHQRAEEERG